MAKTLSNTQRDVLAKMSEGWELGRSTGFLAGAWLQKGGLGKCGETRTVSVSTIRVLEQQGLIKRHYGYPVSTYLLVE